MNLLGVVDVSLLSGNNFDFTVASGTTQDVALDISGGTTLSSAALINTLLLLLGGTNTFQADLAVVNTVTGEVVALASNAVTITAGGVSLITAVAPASATAGGELYGSDFVANEYRAAADAGEFLGESQRSDRGGCGGNRLRRIRVRDYQR